jgi:hypothetical protein
VADAPKLIFDDDWKAQAQKEREKLAEQERQAAAKAGANPAAPGEPGPRSSAGGRDMPPADFQSLMSTLVMPALTYLGAIPDPETGRAIVSLEYARFHIDLLEVLEAKTKGNLSEEEAQDIAQALSELRMRFVEITKAVAEMQAKRAAGGQPGGMPGGMPPGAGLRFGGDTGPAPKF